MRVLRSTPYGDLVAEESAADGNCFYHSYLQCTQAETFAQSNRRESVLRLKRYVAERITPDMIYSLNDPAHFDRLRDRIDEFVRSRGLRPVEFMDSDFSIRGYLLALEKEHASLLKEPEFVAHVHELIQHYGSGIRERIERDGVWADDTILPLFCRIMGVDITFISSSLEPVQLALPTPSDHHIMMLHSGSHFEPLGVRSGGKVFHVLTGSSVEKIILFLKDKR
jgi:hypothetical protein